MRRLPERRAAARLLVVSPVLLVAALLTAIAPGRIAAASQNEAPAGDLRRLQGRVALGQEHTCLVSAVGEVRCFGLNNFGQLGYGDTTNRGGTAGSTQSLAPVQLGSGRRAQAVTAGFFHTCALLDNGSVKCWGRSNNGQLGYGDISSRGDAPGEMGDALPAVNLGSGRTAKMIAAQGVNTCAILDNNTVKCWGLNNTGQLGLGDNATRGDQPGEMGDALPAVDLGPGRSAIVVATGVHTCAILDDSTLKCWGANGTGQLGQGDTDHRGDNPAEMGASLPAVNLGTGVVPVAVVTGEGALGAGHTCVLSSTGTTKCWGRYKFGELASGATNNVGDEASEMGNGLPATNWGTGRVVRTISAAPGRTCVLLDNSAVKCAGFNASGQAGYGNVDNRATEAGDIGDNLPTVPLHTSRYASAVVASQDHTCALLDDDELTCWGSGAYGQLGTGATDNRGDAPGEMGDALPTFTPGGNPTARFTPLAPVRLFDTRFGPGPMGMIPPGGTITIQVTGQAGIPASNVSAVVLNVTTTETLQPGHVTVFPAHVRRPLASNLNIEGPAQTIPNLVTVRLSPEGQVSLYTSAGGHLLADVAGYYTPATSSGAGRYVALTPFRVFDTRTGSFAQKIPAGQTIRVNMAGIGSIPAGGVSAVALNVTATEAQGAGYVTVFPAGLSRPLASNLNLMRVNQTIPNQVIVPLGPDGRIDVYASVTTHVLADVAGYFTDATHPLSSNGLFVSLPPTRILDTRSGAKPVASSITTVNVAGTSNVPAAQQVAGVALNVTATEPAGPGHVTAYPAGQQIPLASTLNVERLNHTIPNHALVTVGGGAFSLFTIVDTHLVVDLNGYYTS